MALCNSSTDGCRIAIQFTSNKYINTKFSTLCLSQTSYNVERSNGSNGSLLLQGTCGKQKELGQQNPEGAGRTGTGEQGDRYD